MIHLAMPAHGSLAHKACCVVELADQQELLDGATDLIAVVTVMNALRRNILG